MKSFVLISVTLFSLLLALADANAQIPRTLSYQGVLTDASGSPRPDGAYSFTFRLYDVPTGGTPIWSEQKSLEVKRGLFSTALGDATPFGASVKFDKPYWLGIQVGNELELAPRIPLTSVGYSMNSLRADTAKVGILSLADTTWRRNGANIYRLNSKVGIGTTNPSQELEIVGSIKSRGAYSDTGTAALVYTNDSGYLYLGPESGTSTNGGNITIWGRSNTTPNGMPGGILFHTSGYDVPPMIIESNGLVHVDNTLLWGRNRANLHHGHGGSIELGGGDFSTGVGTPFIDFHYTGKSEDYNVRIINDGDGRLSFIARRTVVSVLEIIGGSDLAEPFEISHAELLPEGSLVVIDKDNPGKLKQATEPYDKRVAGVISGAGGVNPGLTLSQEGVLEGGQHVALTGKVYALATAANGPIEPGDLLTTSLMPGHAMKATDVSRSHGTIIGKAMSRLENGEGLVLVLVNLQ